MRVTRAAFAVALVSMSVMPRASAATRTLTVAPGTGLVDQAVTVHWSGFTPTDLESLSNTVSVMQCKGNPRTLDDCYQLLRPPGGLDPAGTAIQDAITNADGTGDATIEVRGAL